MSITAKIETLREQRQKAISHHPELAGRVHISSQYADSVAVDLEEYVDYARVYSVYAWVRKAISKTGESIAPLPVRVVDINSEEVEGHDLTQLLAYVNDSMSPADLWQAWTVHMMLGGESFLELLGNSRGVPVEIWPRRPDHVLVVPDASPERLLYPKALEYVYEMPNQEPVRIDAPDMVHDKFYNPLSRWRGLAPITAVREGITIDLFAQAWSKTFLKRGARPDFAVVSPLGMTRTEKEEIVSDLMASHSGESGWHRPIVLEKEITDIKPFSWAPKDVEWLEQREFARDEVGAIFGVPDEIMGYGRDTYENFQTALEVFWTLTLLPLIQHRDTSLTHHFTKVRPILKPGQRIETDLASVGVLQEDMTPKLEQAKQLWSLGVPFNTVEERLGLGIGPIPGGDVGYLPFSVVPVGSERGGVALPLPEPEQGEQLQLPASVTKAAVPEYGSPRHAAMWKAFEARRRPHELRMQRQLKRDFQDQQNRALRNVRDVFGEQAAKQLKQGVVLDASDVLDWDAEVREFVELYLSQFETVAGDFGAAQLAALGLGQAFDLNDPLIREAIRQMTIKFAKDITQTTQERIADELREILIEAEDEGLGIPQIQEQIYQRISTVYETRKSDYETERIARTEMTKASNNAQIEGMRQSGMVQRKGWLAALDGRERDAHRQAHMDYSEKGIGLEEPFIVGGEALMYPGDEAGSAGNIINCRCSVVALV